MQLKTLGRTQSHIPWNKSTLKHNNSEKRGSRENKESTEMTVKVSEKPSESSVEQFVLVKISLHCEHQLPYLEAITLALMCKIL